MADFDSNTIICPFDELGLIKSENKDGEETMRMYGWASTPALDVDQERVMQEGLDCSELLKSGWINWNHQSEKIIGIPEIAEVRDRGNDLGKGLYTEFELLDKVPLAKEVWTLSKALKDSPRALGLSLEGKKLVQNGGNIVKAKVLNIALCPNPRNTETTARALFKAIVDKDVEAFAPFSPENLKQDEMVERVGSIVSAAMTNMTKALSAGYDVGGATQTDGAAVRKEDMDLSGEELVKIAPDAGVYKQELSNAEAQHIRNALKNIADKRGGRLTKAEASLLTFLVSDPGNSLLQVFEIFGLK
jgi:hypothetical protein